MTCQPGFADNVLFMHNESTLSYVSGECRCFRQGSHGDRRKIIRSTPGNHKVLSAAVASLSAPRFFKMKLDLFLLAQSISVFDLDGIKIRQCVCETQTNPTKETSFI